MTMSRYEACSAPPLRAHNPPLSLKGTAATVTEQPEGAPSLTELWARQRDLVSALAGYVAHDLNNLLATVQTNAFLLDGRVMGEDAESLAGIVAAVDLGESLPGQLLELQVGSRHQPAPVTLGHVRSQVQDVLSRSSRNDVICSITLADDAREARIESTQVELGFLALVALAFELLPHGGQLAVALSLRPEDGASLSLQLSAARIPPFLWESQAGPAGVGELSLPRLVRWLARRHGGDLKVELPAEGGLGFELLLPEAESLGVEGLGQEA
jgi:signal transduction histidine kinase